MSAGSEEGGWVEEVLSFWFDELSPEDWFRKSDELDERIRQRFETLYKRVADAPVELFISSPRTALAAVIVLDQFPRNMYRDSAKAFATDVHALGLCQTSLAMGLDGALSLQERKFLYMPFMHSEEKRAQSRSVKMFARLDDETSLDFARRHKEIIDRFGRFPHRNEALGRETTEAEAEFLQQPGSSF